MNFYNSENKERIFEKTTTERITERPFTTESKYYVKRGCTTVRTRAMLFIETLKQMGYTQEIPIEQAKKLFSKILGIYDPKSLKAYFGTLPGKSTRHIRRTARYQTGTYSFKNIELAQDIPKNEGYLEKLGLVTYEKRGKIWFIVFENRVLVSQLERVSECSNDNISLPSIPIHQSVSENRSSPEGTLRGQELRTDLSEVDLIDTVRKVTTKRLQTNNNL